MRIALALALVLCSCGAQFAALTPVQKADVAINAAAQGLHDSDIVADVAFQNCLTMESSGAPLSTTCGQKYRTLATAETVAYQALIAAEHTVNAVDAASKPCGVKAAITQAVTALGAVGAAVTALGANIPASLTAALPGVAALAAPFVCQDGGQ